ncbi:MAG: ribonuclease Z [Coprococcus sp.]|nr:ribonuclease Z [Coprococcus sp.]
MIIIACVDDKNGMMFYGRRQSRDRVLIEDILLECTGKKLRMAPYSYALFEKETDAGILVSEDFLAAACGEDYCFVENGDAMADHLEKVRAVLLYRWNRVYPADVYFPLNLADGSWEQKAREEFQGSSHEKITREWYERAG